jgi:hypothetical protein
MTSTSQTEFEKPHNAMSHAQKIGFQGIQFSSFQCHRNEKKGETSSSRN